MGNDLKEKAVAIVPSAGMGRRMGSRKKNFLMLKGRPVLSRTLEALEAAPSICSIILVLPPSSEDVELCRKDVIEPYGFRKIAKIVGGGMQRQDSVYNGLIEAEGCGFIAVHDGARPLVTVETIEEVVKAASIHGAAIAAVPVKDTIKEAHGGAVKRTIPRDGLWSVQTPQAFRFDMIKDAFGKARRDGFIGTDESMLVERLGAEVRIVMGAYENIKITTEEDMLVAGLLLDRRAGAAR